MMPLDRSGRGLNRNRANTYPGNNYYIVSVINNQHNSNGYNELDMVTPSTVLSDVRRTDFRGNWGLVQSAD